MIISGAIPPDTAWFARAGRALSMDDYNDSHAYLVALGYGAEIDICATSTWREAEAILRSPGWDTRWWDREEAERARLKGLIGVRCDEVAALERLSATTELHADVIHDAAMLAAVREGGVSDALIGCASGAAAMALHEHALATLAGCSHGHLFMRKYRLFACGRWPLAVLRNRFHVF